ncbi:trypsin-like peptidase domain-containing protein [Nocardioides sp. LMS-CY]|uniref:S1C family serine protease n=1 Tax=Nocardioides sp. (strain LMS-CY) TaxID=2840457 RepID=UPI001C001247|nr:trypsin-like peptidase domain-containing protein [Nocardioides sp. LMS-CY]QWF21483.1 trypsin-like peptidase domain-containing protein [Nocardioides sp. LMS-CY]
MTDEQPTTPQPGQQGQPQGPQQQNPYFSYPVPQGPPPEAPPTNPYAADPYAADSYAADPAAQQTATLPVQRRPRRAGLAAAVVTTALVVGAGAGLGGAAAWSALDDGNGSTGGGQHTTTSQVVDTPDTPAASGSVEQVAAKVLPSVVKIDVSGSQGSGSGSGIILSSDGEILTNNHVASIAGNGGAMTVFFNDGSSAKATIVGTDPLTDTAVIKAEGVSGLTPATIGKSSDLKVGESVVAIGSPFGLDSTVTSGIVSALNRPVDVGSDSEGTSTTYPAIQTDAAINPGNSGGALVDMNGNVVGINSSIRTASSGGESGSIGLGFAIPIDEVLPIVDQMRNGETPTHARLGISVSDVANQNGAEVVQGAEVQTVSNGSTAADAGIAKGDVITKVDDHLITGADSLVATIRSYRPGDKVTVTFTHDGDQKTATLTLDSDANTSDS